MPKELQENIMCRIGVEYPLPLTNELESRKEGIKEVILLDQRRCSQN